MSKCTFRQKLTKNFTTIPNELLRNSELSWKAKGIHAYLLSLPEVWVIHLNHLKKISTDGYDSTVAGVNELLEKKYLWRRPCGGNKPGGWDYFVYQFPQLEDPFGIGDSPTRENPESGKPATNKEREEIENKETNGFVADAPETIGDDLFPNLDSANTADPRIADRSAMASRPLQSKENLAAFQKRANRLLGRRETTNWSASEIRAAKANLETCEEDWKLLEKYYANRGKDGFYTRRSMLTLLNNWAGEIDKARSHYEKESENEYKCDDFKL